MSGPSVQTFSLGVVLLAAGRSTRMGTAKMLLPWEGTSIIGHLIRQWISLRRSQIGVVCAPGDSLVSDELDRLQFPKENRILNPAPERGMFSSIQCAALWDGWTEGLTHWVIVLGDQPHLRDTSLRTLLGFAAENPARICQPAYVSRPRHPVVLPRSVFLALGSTAAGNLKEFCSVYERALCEINHPGLDLDIDRPEDYQRALELYRSAR